MRLDARMHVGSGLLEHVVDDLVDQVVLAGEVVADHTLADTEPHRDTSKRGLGVANLRNRVDRRLHDLRPPGSVDERPAVTRCV